MASSSSLIEAMNNVLLEEEEEAVLAIEEEEDLVNQQLFSGYNAKLCLVARFLTEGRVDFPAMQHTMAALWKPGKGVYIKELDAKMYLFQFYHELDVRRVIEGSPWSFNRRALVISRMEENVNPRCVRLNSLDLWVQIYDLRSGFMSQDH